MTPCEAEKLMLNLDRYRDMCEMIGLVLGQAVDYCMERNKLPTVLLPSRGAIPLLTTALALTNYEPLCSARFYPHSAASVITANRISFSTQDDASVDIIQYPFTADVVEKLHSEAEKEAHRIRGSCAKAFANLTGTSEDGYLDLAWNQFLTRRLLRPSSSFNPISVINDLARVDKNSNRTIVLLDTVISGRAASDSTEAFHKLGVDVIPVLATDESEPGSPKIQPRYKHKITQNVDSEYFYSHEKDIFIEGPIWISEDRGANFLGAVSVFFRGFDKPKFFQKINSHFASDFQPSSGIWTFPPDTQPSYRENYRNFLGVVLGEADPRLFTEILENDRSRTSLPLKDLAELTALKSIPHGTKANETASHILTVDFPEEYRAELIREFAQEI